MRKYISVKFRFDEKYFYVFLIALAIFIAGIQIGIKHGRVLELDDLRIKYGYYLSN